MSNVRVEVVKWPRRLPPINFWFTTPLTVWGLVRGWLQQDCHYYCNNCYYCVTVHLGSLLESETVVERQLRMSGQQGPIQGHGAKVTNKQMNKQKRKRTQILASVIPALPLKASQNDPQKKHGLWGFDSRHPSLLAKNRVFCCWCCWWWWSNNSLNNEISPPFI